MEYEGFGILKIEFTRACDWYTSSTITLTDAGGISHDDERCPGK